MGRIIRPSHCVRGKFNFSPDLNISLSNLGFLCPDGRCFIFDSRANGYARGEGFAVSVVKRKSCVTKHDRVRALIRSISTNKDGSTSGGITQPSKDKQIRLMKEAYTKAGLKIHSTAYLEAHDMLSHLLPTLADTVFS